MPSSKPTPQELTALFYKTPEMQECQTMAGTITNQIDDEDTVKIEIELPRALVTLAEFIEQKRAVRAGVAPLRVAKVLQDVLKYDLHDDLNWLSTAPAHFGFYRDLWNSFCDAHGAPEHKIVEGSSL